jgi:ABC-type phosphate transport system substrate-binding protein
MKLIILIVVLFTSFVGSTALAEIYVVVNPENIDQVDAVKIKQIFSGKSTILKPCDNKNLLDSFYRVATGRTSRAALMEWAKLVFKGKGDKPDVLNGDAAVVNWIKSNLKGIGYVSSKHTGVKVIHTFK